jgi:hypothetical protein
MQAKREVAASLQQPQIHKWSYNVLGGLLLGWNNLKGVGATVAKMQQQGGGAMDVGVE